MLLLLEEFWILLKSALKKQQHYFRKTAICKEYFYVSMHHLVSVTWFLQVIPTRVIKCQRWKGPENQFDSTLPRGRRGNEDLRLSLPGPHGQTGTAITLPDNNSTCPSHGPRIFIEEGDVCFPFSPLHLVDPASGTIILNISQLHLIKHRQHEVWGVPDSPSSVCPRG